MHGGPSGPAVSTQASRNCSPALNDEARSVLTDATGASWAPRHFEVGEPEPAKQAGKKAPEAAKAAPGLSSEQVRAATLDSLRALMMIRVYRVRGHLEAQLDPLGLTVPKSAPELDPATYGFTEPATWTARCSSTTCWAGDGDPARDPGRAAADLLRPDRRRVHAHPGPGPEGLVAARIEGAPWVGSFDVATKRTILRQLTEAEGFEAFCQKRLRRHQAVRTRRRRGHHPRPARHHRDGGQGRAWSRLPSACRIAAGSTRW